MTVRYGETREQKIHQKLVLDGMVVSRDEGCYRATARIKNATGNPEAQSSCLNCPYPLEEAPCWVKSNRHSL